ncbi:MAG TPA: MT-A70 family methyltransferase [Roseiarcus sp.]|nr:MT-A70 family methyltransferase [Roseiarcus sp.]
MADPPWRFQNFTGKVGPEHRRLSRYGTLELGDIMALPVPKLCEDVAHLYLWVPNALLPEGLAVLKAWGFSYKSNIVWHKVRKDGGQGRILNCLGGVNQVRFERRGRITPCRLGFSIICGLFPTTGFRGW